MTEQFRIALIRAVLTAFVTGGATFFTVIATADMRAALISTGATVFATLAARFAAEGWVDTSAAKRSP